MTMPERHNTEQDKNFDDLTHHFKRNIYGRLKGQIRLAVIERDLAPYLTEPCSIIDAGGGQGQFALQLAHQGHQVSLCDISEQMLELAREAAKTQALSNIDFYHCPLQDLAQRIQKPADIVFCHAVMEWMSEPESALSHLHDCLKPGGILSLAFFNVNSIIYKNLLRGNYYKVNSGNYVGMEGSLTPINPLKIEDVFQWCERNDFDILDHSGIRVFHDYIADQATRNRHPEAVLEMELQFSKQEPYRSLGRYIHLVAKRKSQ